VREGQFDTWVFDFQRRNFDKVTASPHNDDFPVWTPDGQKIVTGSGPGLFWRSADGSGGDEALTASTYNQFPLSFTPDSTNLVLAEARGGDTDLSVLTLNGSRQVRPLTGLNTTANEASAELSPDGRWLAYQSNESGRFQIYVRPFPDVASSRFTISPKERYECLGSRVRSVVLVHGGFEAGDLIGAFITI
jgi:Tol biopolymer transport system component